MRLKSFFSLFLCVVISFSMLAACSDNSGDKLMSFLPETESNADFNGKELKIVGLYREGIAEVAPVSFENAYSDMLIEHYKTVGSKYNIKIVAEGSDTIVDDITLKSAVGDKFADVIDDSLSSILDLYNSDILLDVSSVLDYSELYSGKYGTSTQLGASTLKRLTGDEVFGFVSAYWGVPTPKFANAGYFNPDFVSMYNLANPYELLENDNWTWAQFEKMCIAVQSEGNDPADEADDIYGIAEDPDQNYLAKTAFNSNDANLVAYDESTGLYSFSLEDPKVEETLQWLQGLYKSGALRIVSGTTGNSTIGNLVNNFIEERAMFMVEHTYHGTTDRESLAYRANFDFSWIPFPKGPSAELYNYNASISGADRYYGLPAIGTDDETLSIIIPELFSSFEGLDNLAWRDYFSMGMFFSDESQEWFFKMYENVSNNYDWLTGFFNSSYSAKIIDESKSIAEILQSYANLGQKEIDKKLNVQ